MCFVLKENTTLLSLNIIDTNRVNLAQKATKTQAPLRNSSNCAKECGFSRKIATTLDEEIRVVSGINPLLWFLHGFEHLGCSGEGYGKRKINEVESRNNFVAVVIIRNNNT